MTSGFTDAIVDLKAVEAVPWGPHFGLRIRFRTNMKSMTVPEIVRPKPIDEAVKELEKLGLIEDNSEGTPKITWREAIRITKRHDRQSNEEAKAAGSTRIRGGHRDRGKHEESDVAIC